MTVAQSVPAVTAAWIDKYGNFYAVEYGYHRNFARDKWHDIDRTRDYSNTGCPVEDLENAGWIHISNTNGDLSKDPYIIARHKINSEQFDTMFDWLMSHQNAGNTRFADGIRRYINHRVEQIDSDYVEERNPFRPYRHGDSD